MGLRVKNKCWPFKFIFLDFFTNLIFFFVNLFYLHFFYMGPFQSFEIFLSNFFFNIYIYIFFLKLGLLIIGARNWTRVVAPHVLLLSRP